MVGVSFACVLLVSLGLEAASVEIQRPQSGQRWQTEPDGLLNRSACKRVMTLPNQRYLCFLPQGGCPSVSRAVIYDKHSIQAKTAPFYSARLADSIALRNYTYQKPQNVLQLDDKGTIALVSTNNAYTVPLWDGSRVRTAGYKTNETGRLILHESPSSTSDKLDKVVIASLTIDRGELRVFILTGSGTESAINVFENVDSYKEDNRPILTRRLPQAFSIIAIYSSIAVCTGREIYIFTSDRFGTNISSNLSPTITMQSNAEIRGMRALPLQHGCFAVSVSVQLQSRWKCKVQRYCSYGSDKSWKLDKEMQVNSDQPSPCTSAPVEVANGFMAVAANAPGFAIFGYYFNLDTGVVKAMVDDIGTMGTVQALHSFSAGLGKQVLAVVPFDTADPFTFVLDIKSNQFTRNSTWAFPTQIYDVSPITDALASAQYGYVNLLNYTTLKSSVEGNNIAKPTSEMHLSTCNSEDFMPTLLPSSGNLLMLASGSSPMDHSLKALLWFSDTLHGPLDADFKSAADMIININKTVIDGNSSAADFGYPLDGSAFDLPDGQIIFQVACGVELDKRYQYVLLCSIHPFSKETADCLRLPWIEEVSGSGFPWRVPAVPVARDGMLLFNYSGSEGSAQLTWWVYSNKSKLERWTTVALLSMSGNYSGCPFGPPVQLFSFSDSCVAFVDYANSSVALVKLESAKITISGRLILPRQALSPDKLDSVNQMPDGSLAILGNSTVLIYHNDAIRSCQGEIPASSSLQLSSSSAKALAVDSFSNGYAVTSNAAEASVELFLTSQDSVECARLLAIPSSRCLLPTTSLRTGIPAKFVDNSTLSSYLHVAGDALIAFFPTAGQYKQSAGLVFSNFTTVCPPNSYSSADHSTCSPCEEGSFSFAEMDSCPLLSTGGVITKTPYGIVFLLLVICVIVSGRMWTCLNVKTQIDDVPQDVLSEWFPKKLQAASTKLRLTAWAGNHLVNVGICFMLLLYSLYQYASFSDSIEGTVIFTIWATYLFTIGVSSTAVFSSKFNKKWLIGRHFRVQCLGTALCSILNLTCGLYPDTLAWEMMQSRTHSWVPSNASSWAHPCPDECVSQQEGRCVYAQLENTMMVQCNFRANGGIKWYTTVTAVLLLVLIGNPVLLTRDDIQHMIVRESTLTKATILRLYVCHVLYWVWQMLINVWFWAATTSHFGLGSDCLREFSANPVLFGMFVALVYVPLTLLQNEMKWALKGQKHLEQHYSSVHSVWRIHVFRFLLCACCISAMLLLNYMKDCDNSLRIQGTCLFVPLCVLAALVMPLELQLPNHEGAAHEDDENPIQRREVGSLLA